MPKIIEKGTRMSQVMIVVEFETKPEHRSQFIDLMRGHAERS
jgi:quinol monooxygenase YgiN